MTYPWKTLAAAVAAVNLIAISMWIDPPPRLIWNASPSVPIGFYRVRVGDPVSRGELAVVLPPPDIARFLAEGGYLPLGLPLLKRVAALPEQTVCRTGDTISIDGDVVAVAQTTDRLGRALPVWTGCRTLAADQLFFLNADREDSLDGRYFGPLPAATVIGRATPM
ncbi:MULTISPECIES: S26 family signal peptidase [Sphingomonadales]|uniref:Conjugative transfer signal peptidase TraF n=1 Tax=Sphingobium scionense TaxID=1404341 RepID=A0A7W6LTF6_9SPHN|nr:MULTISPECIES: S26 family signal peptidase [Sphingomonadaceae]AGH51488.1 Peptidase S26 [Sphingomonas sp. MM-1]MBB4150170.1 conjugative transfer signal peptidase TraF [Sphingobium scionense]